VDLNPEPYPQGLDASSVTSLERITDLTADSMKTELQHDKTEDDSMGSAVEAVLR